jgi:hypothetical protein
MKQKTWHLIYLLPLLFIILTLSYCSNKQEVRKYQDKTVSSEPVLSKTDHQQISVIQTKNFSWEIPDGWEEVKSNSKIRLATLVIRNLKQESICTIILLPGKAGTLKANIERWLLQISNSPDKIKDNTELLFNQKEAITCKGAFNGFFIDYTAITKNPGDISLLVTVLRVNSNSVFIKLAGPKSILEANKHKFKSLWNSFKSR